MKFSLHHFIAVENGDAGQYYSRNEAEEAMVCPIQNKLARVFADALAHINFKLFENKRKEQSDSRRRQWLMTLVTIPGCATDAGLAII